jgi:cellulose synthase/poly-beta-1,6-N-acetylglucosamine synthase-like glycosyltransferase
MAFRGPILAELAPRLHTLAEDLEMDVLLSAGGHHVAFVSEAVVYDPKPHQLSGASRQRARWFAGQVQVLRSYWREIFRAIVKGGIGSWFLLPLLIMRPKILFIALRVMVVALLFCIPGSSWALFVFVSLGLTFDLLYYLAGAAFVDNSHRYILDLLAVPRYAAIWIYSFGIATFHRIYRRGHQIWLKAGRQLQ